MTSTTILEPARVWLRRGALDRSLARGANPTATPALARRSRQLTSRRFRTTLAAALCDRIDQAAEQQRGISAQAALQRSAILRERGLLLALAADLESADEVNARGVALVEQLLVDGDSPLYASSYPETLREALCQARAALHLA